jgi:hypothetical protein
MPRVASKRKRSSKRKMSGGKRRTSRKKTGGKRKTSRKKTGGKRKTDSKKKCKSGYILRDAYTRKTKSGKTTKVSSSCIKKQGRPGVKGPKLIKMRKEDIGLLKNVGYELDMSKNDRHKSLDKAVRKYNALKILRHVNALRTFNKSYKEHWKRYDDDVKYLERKYFAGRHGAEKSKASPYTSKERSKKRTRREVSQLEKAARRKRSSRRSSKR